MAARKAPIWNVTNAGPIGATSAYVTGVCVLGVAVVAAVLAIAAPQVMRERAVRLHEAWLLIPASPQRTVLEDSGGPGYLGM